MRGSGAWAIAAEAHAIAIAATCQRIVLFIVGSSRV